MCECQKRYCFGCGKRRELVAGILLCGECYADWLRLAPGRLRGQEEAHVR